MGRPRSDMPSTKPCAHPGCKVTLNKRQSTYDTGFCRHHGGIVKGRSQVVVAQPVVVEVRPDVRVAEVSGAAPGYSYASEVRARVSLKKEPWL